MVSHTYEEALELLPNGKCPNCFIKVKIALRDRDLFKTKFVQRLKNGISIFKCPGRKCKEMLTESLF